MDEAAMRAALARAYTDHFGDITEMLSEPFRACPRNGVVAGLCQNHSEDLLNMVGGGSLAPKKFWIAFLP